MTTEQEMQATPHEDLIWQLLDSSIPKTDREHAAAREIEGLREWKERALELARKSHGTLLLTDPPQDPWKAQGVDWKLSDAIKAIHAAIDEAEKQESAKAWVGLTDEEIAELRRNGAHSVSEADFRAIETRLKEKNT